MSATREELVEFLEQAELQNDKGAMDQILTRLEEMQAQEQPAPAQPAPAPAPQPVQPQAPVAPPEPSYIQSVQQMAEEGSQKMEAALQDYKEGKTGTVAAAGRFWGEWAGTTTDIASKTISAITPQLVKDWIKMEWGANAEPFMKTDFGKKFAGAVAGGVEKLAELQEAYPEEFKTTVGWAKTMGIASPFARIQKKPSSKWLDDVVTRFQSQFEQRLQTKRTEVNMWGTNVVSLDKQQEEIKKILTEIPAIKRGALGTVNYRQIQNVVNKEVGEESTKLLGLLKASGKKVNSREVDMSIKRTMDKLWETEDFVDANPAISVALRKRVNKIFEGQPQTVDGLLKARQTLDQYIKNRSRIFAKQAKGGDIVNITPQDIAMVSARDSLNQLLHMKSAGLGKTVKDSLKRQHYLLKAEEILMPKKADKYFIERLYHQKVEPFVSWIPGLGKTEVSIKSRTK